MPGLRVLPLEILPVTYQSHDIPLSDWISILTLCLAPLIAHVTAGTPRPSYLSGHRPRWHDRICHYNPTSILWRYAAIADRRIRARSWGPIEVAATNALFWTSRGWDASEEMVDLSLAHCTHLPEQSRIALFSLETIKTIIITCQGIQAISLLTGSLSGGVGDYVRPFTVLMAVDIVFFPLAFIGLLRLFCCLWLTDDFLYSGSMTFDCDTIPQTSARSADRLVYCVDDPPTNRFRATSFWPSRLFRVLYLLPILGLWIMTVIVMLVAGYLTATDFLVVLLFFVLLGATAAIFSYSFAIGHTTTTIVPCISSLWYKIYSGMIMALAVVLIIVASIETRKNPCGKYTSGVGSDGDALACQTAKVHVVAVGSTAAYFALASTANSAANNSDTARGGPVHDVYNFTGTCVGEATYNSALIVVPEGVQ